MQKEDPTMLTFIPLSQPAGPVLALNPQPLPPGLHFADGSVRFGR